MRAVATIERKPDSGIYAEDSVLRFAEGLIGFSDCKNFVLLESEGIAPFRRLRDDLCENRRRQVPHSVWCRIGHRWSQMYLRWSRF